MTAPNHKAETLVARAICAERCAFMGEPPCWKLDGSNGDLSPECDDPGCMALAQAVVASRPSPAPDNGGEGADIPEGVPSAFLEALIQEVQWETGEKVMGKQTLYQIAAELLEHRRAALRRSTFAGVEAAGLRKVAEEAYWLLAWTWPAYLFRAGPVLDMSTFAPEAREMMNKAEQDLFDALSALPHPHQIKEGSE